MGDFRKDDSVPEQAAMCLTTFRIDAVIVTAGQVQNEPKIGRGGRRQRINYQRELCFRSGLIEASKNAQQVRVMSVGNGIIRSERDGALKNDASAEAHSHS